MGISTEMFRKIDQLSPELKDVFMTFVDEMDKSVKKEDFDELKELVSELAKAQKRTENSLLELAEAQKRTEEKLEQLTIRVDELAEIQKKTEKKLNELAEAQKKTEEELKLLVKEHKRTREILGGLSDIVGYGIEDQIAPFIFDFSQKEFGVEVQNITRKNLVYPDGAYDEVNIFAEGKKNGEKVYLIGECKTRPGKKDVDKFYSRLLRIRGYLNTTVYPFFVGYVYHPEVENYIQEKYPDLKYLKSIDFFVNYKKRWD
ncbi:MAG: hypothetical protein N3C60_01150 [Calditerrivibrio sp.]|nr:hypothetical protein [Calditerrivibrio sp.]